MSLRRARWLDNKSLMKLKSKIFSGIMAIVMGVIPFASSFQSANVCAAEPAAQIKEIKLEEGTPVKTDDEKNIQIKVINEDKNRNYEPRERKKFTFGLVMKNSLACLGWAVVAVAGGALVGAILASAGNVIELLAHTGGVIPLLSKIFGISLGVAPSIIKIGENIYEIVTAR